MELQNNNELDSTGKVVLDEIYNRSDPIAYFNTLGGLDYLIPQAAKPVFANVVEAYRSAKEQSSVKVLDLGCSYGVNAALLKNDLTMRDLYGLYDRARVDGLDRSELIERDQRIFGRDSSPSIEVIGLDAAPLALAYAEEARIVDGTVNANLEAESLTSEQQALISGADLVISTGCIGYITERTIRKVLEANGDQKPWMAHFVLRMFPFESIAEVLADNGYVTAKGTKTAIQRRFASPEEQEQVLERLIGLGIDPSGIETEGHFHADLYVSRPVEDCRLVPSPELVAF